MQCLRRLVLALAISGALVLASAASAASPADGLLVFPRPRWIEATGDAHRLGADARGPCLAVVGDAERVAAPEVERALAWLGTALTQAGARLEAGAAEGCSPLALTRLDAGQLAARWKETGLRFSVPPLAQSYALRVDGDAIALAAGGSLGASYGLTTLAQLVAGGGDAGATVTRVHVVDGPAVRHRVLKLSGTHADARQVRGFAEWSGPLHTDLLALQYHGHSAREPEPDFLARVDESIALSAELGSFGTLVYFSPFRGAPAHLRKGKASAPRMPFSGGDVAEGALDLTKRSDMKRYLALVEGWVRAGAAGIEVDYNDFDDATDTSMSQVTIAVRDLVKEIAPDAHVMLCPSASGLLAYHGLANRAMRGLSRDVPKDVWMLWTGSTVWLSDPLPFDAIKTWEATTERKPFLWINRVSPVGKQQLWLRPSGSDAIVFDADRLPRDLGEGIEGAHLNLKVPRPPSDAPVPERKRRAIERRRKRAMARGELLIETAFQPELLQYFATATDFLWNPRDWSALGTARRAEAFVAFAERVGGLPVDRAPVPAEPVADASAAR